jgi:hypothetical protein
MIEERRSLLKLFAEEIPGMTELKHSSKDWMVD